MSSDVQLRGEPQAGNKVTTSINSAAVTCTYLGLEVSRRIHVFLCTVERFQYTALGGAFGDVFVIGPSGCLGRCEHDTRLRSFGKYGVEEQDEQDSR